MSPSWRKKLSELGRGTGHAHAPLFAPLLYGVCAQIEARSPAEVTADPTRLGKCLSELKRASGTTALTVAAPTLMEAEALGAEVDRGQWPPRWVSPSQVSILGLSDFDDLWRRSDALAASIEVSRRTASVDSEVVLLPALTGPASLLRQLFGEVEYESAHWEFAGRALAALARQFCTAGVSGLLFCESERPDDEAGWQAALATISNIARFHRLPALLAAGDANASRYPDATVPCPPAGEACDRPHGASLSPEFSAWEEQLNGVGAARVLVTAAEVDAHADIEDLFDACEHGLDAQGA